MQNGKKSYTKNNQQYNNKILSFQKQNKTTSLIFQKTIYEYSHNIIFKAKRETKTPPT